MTKIKKQKKCRHVDQNDEWSLSVVEVARGVPWRHRKGFINQASAIAGHTSTTLGC